MNVFVVQKRQGQLKWSRRNLCATIVATGKSESML